MAKKVKSSRARAFISDENSRTSDSGIVLFPVITIRINDLLHLHEFSIGTPVPLDLFRRWTVRVVLRSVPLIQGKRTIDRFVIAPLHALAV